jgi:hypothetical protein
MSFIGARFKSMDLILQGHPTIFRQIHSDPGRARTRKAERPTRRSTLALDFYLVSIFRLMMVPGPSQKFLCCIFRVKPEGA